MGIKLYEAMIPPFSLLLSIQNTVVRIIAIYSNSVVISFNWLIHGVPALYRPPPAKRFLDDHLCWTDNCVTITVDRAEG